METRFDTQDIVGKQFGKLTVLEYCGRNEKGRHIYKCQCECGSVCIVQEIVCVAEAQEVAVV